MAIGALALGVTLSPSAAVAAFPGGNGLIAFSGAPAGESNREIYTIRPDGSDLRQVTDSDPYTTEPSWSADGRRIVYAEVISREGPTPQDPPFNEVTLLTIDPDGGNPTQVVEYVTSTHVRPSPSFSPSGGRILYAAGDGIRTIRPDGTDPRRLGKGEYPQYSPSGGRIAFVTRGGIATMRRDGSHRHQLTKHDPNRSDLSDLAPDYSPDGRRIAFVRDTFLEAVGLWLMRADGSGKHPILTRGSDYAFPAASSPAFAPAGDRMAVSRIDGSTKYPPYCSDIYTTSSTGSDGQKVTNACLGPYSYGLGGVAFYPSWQPDPASTFLFAKMKRNRRKGTANLTAKVPGPGELELAKNKKVKGKHKSADSEGTVKLSIKPRRKAKKQLNRKGKAKVKAEVTYTPDGGPPNTQSKKVGLKKKR